MHWTHIDVGHELASLNLTLSSEQVRRYAIVARMPGGRFLSDAEAQEEGLAGQIVPGNLSLSLFVRLILTALPGARIERLHGTFRGLVRPGVPLVVRGVVTERRGAELGDVIECDLVLESEEGDRWVTGTARVLLPSS